MKINHSQYIKFIDQLYGQFQFKTSGINHIPKGQIEYHKKNFSKYFNLRQKNFLNKKILETGAGPGIHAAILAIMGAEVKALDLSKSNISKIKNLKKIYNLSNLTAELYDLTNQYDLSKRYDYISCHNWVQHTPNPGEVIKKLSNNLNVNGIFYISCYHSSTFRFLITQTARKLLNYKDFEKTKEILKYKIPSRYDKYQNIDDINLENLFDDFFTPYCITTNYENLIKNMKKIGYDCISKIPKYDNIHLNDNIFLRASFKKIRDIKNEKINISFKNEIDELSLTKNYKIKETIRLLKKAITFLKKESQLNRILFCASLYEIRAEYSNIKNNDKYYILNDYCKRIISGNLNNLTLKRKN
jgi:2-polyprenyl-3-methyl-5-hydroxy-6-metoxy-1,4-benzoquinol methylase|tara:strand:+ start:800 stop:1873 length:1074 start_codon:yes stop_codon:yes gene_type:complete